MAERHRTLGQLLRFGLVGAVNTVIDFGILNLLVLGTGAHYPWIYLFNTVSFSVATYVSFYLNKHYTFRHRGEASLWRFGGISFTGLIWNNLLLRLVLLWLPASLGSMLALNLGKLTATIGSSVWNYLWYRHWVFRSEPLREPQA